MLTVYIYIYIACHFMCIKVDFAYDAANLNVSEFALTCLVSVFTYRAVAGLAEGRDTVGIR